MSTRLNFARMRSTTGGTGSLVLSPVTTRPTFNQSLNTTSAVYTDFKYTIAEPSTGAFEVGTGTYSAATTTLSSRTPIESWSGSGAVGTSLINFGNDVLVYSGVVHQDVTNADETQELADAQKVQGFAFSIDTLTVGQEVVITSAWPIDVPCTITHITVESKSGTATVAFQIGGVNITGASAVAVSSAGTTVTPSAANVLNQNNRFSLTPSAVSSATDVVVTVRYERAV